MEHYYSPLSINVYKERLEVWEIKVSELEREVDDQLLKSLSRNDLKTFHILLEELKRYYRTCPLPTTEDEMEPYTSSYNNHISWLRYFEQSMRMKSLNGSKTEDLITNYEEQLEGELLESNISLSKEEVEELVNEINSLNEVFKFYEVEDALAQPNDLLTFVEYRGSSNESKGYKGKLVKNLSKKELVFIITVSFLLLVVIVLLISLM